MIAVQRPAIARASARTIKDDVFEACGELIEAAWVGFKQLAHVQILDLSKMRLKLRVRSQPVHLPV